MNINGTNTAYYTQRTGSSADKKTVDVPVSAGEVVITAMNEDASAAMAIVVEKIVFTPTMTVSKTISAAGYATIYSDQALDFTGTGITAYKAVVSGDDVTFEEVTSAPANTGLLLKGAAKEYNIPVTTTPAAVTSAMVGSTTETTVPAGTFVLFQKSGVVGFYKTTAASFTVGANTAWLPADVSARAFIGLDDETTGVSATLKDNGEMTKDKAFFNLNGQRVNANHKGIVVVNGKKFVNK